MRFMRGAKVVKDSNLWGDARCLHFLEHAGISVGIIAGETDAPDNANAQSTATLTSWSTC